MKKRNLVLGMVAFMVGGLSLTACDPVKKEKGTILTINNGSEVAHGITVDDIFNKYITKSTGISTYYNAISEVIIRASIEETPEITKNAKQRVNEKKDEANSNAKTNGTSYNDELDKILESNGVEDLDELQDLFVYEKLKEKARDSYFDNDGGKGEFGLLKEYITQKVPYHVSHILINVSAASTDKGYKGQITESETTKLIGTIKRLARGNETFGSVAQSLSGDSSSAANFGEGDIVTVDTGYVNEFKLGLYAFDAIFNSKEKDANRLESIHMTDTATNYFTTKKNEKAYKIDFQEILDMEKVASKEKLGTGETIKDGDAFYYPRNIYFNSLFNSHQVSLITTKNKVVNGVEQKAFKSAEEVPALAGLLDDGEYALCSGTNPILVVRSGSGDGDSGYQGIFFIVAEKSGLTESTDSLKDYYNYKLSVNDYNQNIGTMYVNFNKQENNEYRKRASTVETAVKNYDSLIDSSIFQYYLNEGKTKFNLKINEDIKVEVPKYVNGKRDGVEYLSLEDAINQYLANTRSYNEYSSQNSMEKTWNEFVESLQVIDQSREDRMLSIGCAKAINSASSKEEIDNLTKEGGVCSATK